MSILERTRTRSRSLRWRSVTSVISSAAALTLLLGGCRAVVTEEAAPAPVVAFYGDSYTLGTGASDSSLRWSTQISAARGWNEFNYSVNGLGFVNNRERLQLDLPRQVIAIDPDIVFVTMGLNDVFSFERVGDGIREQIDRDLTRLRGALPDARVIVVEPFWYAADRPDSLETIIGWVKDFADGIGADYIPGASGWIQGRGGEMASDGLHPNDIGYATITRRMDAALTDLGL